MFTLNFKSQRELASTMFFGSVPLALPTCKTMLVLPANLHYISFESNGHIYNSLTLSNMITLDPVTGAVVAKLYKSMTCLYNLARKRNS